MTRFRNGWFVVAAVAALAGACGKKKDDNTAAKTAETGSGGGGTTDNGSAMAGSGGATGSGMQPAPVPAPNAQVMADLGIIPLDSELIASMNFDELRASALWAKYSPMFMTKMSDQVQKFKDTCGIDPVMQIKSATFGVKNLADAQQGVTIVVRGIDKAKVLDCFSKYKDEAAAKGTTLTIDGETVTIQSKDAKDKTPGIVGFTSDGAMVLVATPTATKDTLTAALAGNSATKTSGVFKEMFSKIDTTSSLWGLVNGSSKVFDSMPSMISRPQAVFGSLDFGSSIKLDVYVRFDSPDKATQVANMGKTQIAGAAKMVNKISMDAWGNDAHLFVDLTDQQLEALVQQFATLIPALVGTPSSTVTAPDGTTVTTTSNHTTVTTPNGTIVKTSGNATVNVTTGSAAAGSGK